MKQFIKEQKDLVSNYVSIYLEQKEKSFPKQNFWAKDVCARLKDYILAGKMIRAGLVMLGYRLAGGKISEKVLPVAAAIELFHAGFLIHDDIMDGDNIRRGYPAIHHQYKLLAEKKSLRRPHHIASSFGICSGNVAYFMGMELLNKLQVAHKNDLITIATEEIIKVGFGQMDDIFFSADKKFPSVEKVIDMYRFKTARYTFSLPLMLGLLCAKPHENLISQLETLGEYMGIIFQIRDDELGLYGDESVTGKPVTSDIREGKKTVYCVELYHAATEEERKNISKINGNREITDEEITYVKELLSHYEIRAKVEHMVESYIEKAETIVENIPGDTDSVDILKNLLYYCVNRSK